MKMKKILSAVLALAMTAMVGISASAEDGQSVTVYDDLNKVGISKTLNVADGIVIEDKVDTFTFSFTGVTSTEGITAKKADEVFSNLNNGSNEITITVGEQSGGVAIGNKTFAEIFGNANNFPGAGEYVYEVKETTEAKGDNPDTPNVIENLTVDSKTYIVHVYVVNDGEGRKYRGITVIDNGEKIDPTIIETEDKEDPDKKVGASGANFTNTYTEDLKNDDGSALLTVKKSITGNYADKTKTFPITVEFVIPDTAKQEDVAVNSTDSISWTSEKEGSFTALLADGGIIEFTKLPVGTTFVVNERQDMYYKSWITGFVEKEDTKYETGPRSVNGAGPITLSEDGKGKFVYIENNRTDIIPTGLVINNLPYIALVLIAAAGLTFFVIKKRAKEN